MSATVNLTARYNATQAQSKSTAEDKVDSSAMNAAKKAKSIAFKALYWGPIALYFAGWGAEAVAEWHHSVFEERSRSLNSGAMTYTMPRLEGHDTDDDGFFMEGYHTAENGRKILHEMTNQAKRKAGDASAKGLSTIAQVVTWIATSPLRTVEKFTGWMTGRDKAHISDAMMEGVSLFVNFVVRAIFAFLELVAQTTIYLGGKGVAVIAGTGNTLRGLKFHSPVSFESRREVVYYDARDTFGEKTPQLLALGQFFNLKEF